nr:unnamed protein product [uncultured bacterium]
MLTEKKEKRIAIRIAETDYDYLSAVAYMAGMTVSKYVRTLCDASINAAKMQELQGRLNIEDFKKLRND